MCMASLCSCGAGRAPSSASQLPQASPASASSEALRSASLALEAVIAAHPKEVGHWLRPPVSWHERCRFLRTESEVLKVVSQQKPPPGVVAVESVRDVTSLKSPADARITALRDMSTSCGASGLDAQLHAQKARGHALFLVTLRTPSGPVALVVRMSRFSEGWRLTGLLD